MRVSFINFVTILLAIWVAGSSAQYSEFDLNGFFRAFSNPVLYNLPPIGRYGGGRKLEIRTLCNAEHPAYEVIEGVKVNAPFCIVKQVPFCNTIEQCLAECNKEPDCASIELNEGKCTLYSVNYDNNPEKFEKAQIKGLHVVVQKRCIEDVGLGSNNNQIATELVPGYCLKGNPVQTVKVSSKNECVQKCLNNRDFVCRSANYDRTRNICELNAYSRESLSGGSKGNQVAGSSSGSGGSGSSGSWSLAGSSSSSRPGSSSASSWNLTGSGMSTSIGKPGSMTSGMFQGSGSHTSSRGRGMSGMFQGAGSGSYTGTSGSHSGSGMFQGSGSHTSDSGSHTSSGSFEGSGSHTSGSGTSSGSIAGSGSHTGGSGSHTSSGSFEGSGSHTSGSGTSSGSISGSGSHGSGSGSGSAATGSGGAGASKPGSNQQQYQFVKSENCLYIENNRVLEPNQVCTFERKENLIPYSFDAFYLDTATEDDCRYKCEISKLGCRSYTFGLFANIPMCFLSHQTSEELLGQEEAFCSLANVTTNQLKSCYNFKMECTGDGFSVYVESSRQFNGAIFPPDKPQCRIEVQNVDKFYYYVPFSDPVCGIEIKKHGYHETELQVQHFRPYITSPDFIFNAIWTCYPPAPQTTTSYPTTITTWPTTDTTQPPTTTWPTTTWPPTTVQPTTPSL